ncbi:MAG: 50S ribosomal protein L25/general stress protein Ctc [Brumimicrobium sp.]
MKVVSLSGSARPSVGKKATRAIRNAGQVPCVLYGGEQQIYFSVRSVDIEKLIFNPDVYFIEIDVDGTKKKAIIQDFQTHPVTDRPLHVDFLELDDSKEVKIGIPVIPVGRARGVIAGGALIANYRKLKVQGLPKDLPAKIEVDVSPLRIGQGIRVGEVNIPGIKILENPNSVIVAVKMVRGAVEEDDEEEGEEATAAEGGEAEAPAEEA